MAAKTCPKCGKEYRRVHHCSMEPSSPEPAGIPLDEVMRRGEAAAAELAHIDRGEVCPTCGAQRRPIAASIDLDCSDPTCGGRMATIPTFARAGVGDVDGKACVLLRLDEHVFAFRDTAESRGVFRGLLELFDHPRLHATETADSDMEAT